MASGGAAWPLQNLHNTNPARLLFRCAARCYGAPRQNHGRALQGRMSGSRLRSRLLATCRLTVSRPRLGQSALFVFERAIAKLVKFPLPPGAGQHG